ncbi:MAG: phospho-N-acetylmuramoyl-pentapeptide-transferase [Phycisphaerales bacterium]|jgi:phospho-N-acetylmuramoyl-pentapeptide-transferase
MLFWLVSVLEGRLPDGIMSILRVLYQEQFRALAAAVLSFALVLFFGKPTIAQLVKFKIGDSGLTDAEALRRGAASKKNTPTMGGVLTSGAVVASALLLGDLSNFYVNAGLLLLVSFSVVGAADDVLKILASRREGGRQGLHSWEKLLFQLGVGALISYFVFRHGDTGSGQDMAHVLNLPFQRSTLPGSGQVNPAVWFLPMGAFVVLGTLMIAGMSNATNITDGMDGLAGGLSAIVAAGCVVLTMVAGWQATAQTLLVPYVPGAEELSILAGGLLGACLGFLWWNGYPAQVFMGDTGSLAIGGLFGYLALVTRQEVVVLLMCGVFLLEIASVVLQVGYFKWTKRTGEGRRIFRCAPFHHHLHLGGLAEPKVVARLWIVGVLLVVLALASIKLR